MASVELPITYRCELDPSAFQRASLANMRRNWLEWLNYGARTGFTYAWLGFLACLVAGFHAGSHDWTGIWQAVALCFAIGLSAPLLEYLDCATSRQRYRFAEAPWDCTLSEQGWSNCDRRGISLFIPWEEMSLTMVTGDVWAVEYGTESHFIFREPLQRNGLEQTFIEKAGWK